MNILDIAIAKKLAGGGGGSGTDNYNDLSNLPKINDVTLSGNKSSSALGLQSEINSESKLASDLVDDTNQDNKFVTSTEKNTWNGKQNAIDADHKINADYVDDSTSTNKFVTASDKETWNAKQNAIDNSHKLSSDLVDDANHTNKFVTSTEKQTWNAKQNAIDADHKLSSSLVSFTTAEAAALASGIDSSKVGQISTNQTNILYALGRTGKNLYDIMHPTRAAHITVTDDGNGQFTQTASGAWAAWDYDFDVTVGTQYTVYIKFKSVTTSNAAGVVVLKDANGNDIYRTSINTPQTFEYTFTAPTSWVRIGVTANNSSYNQSGTFVMQDPMVVEKAVYDKFSDYQPYQGRPNYDLTRLESEDRAGLIECIDGGAKNLLQNKAESKTQNNVTFTVNSIGEVSVSTVGATSANTTLSLTNAYIPNTFKGNIISGVPASTTSNTICMYVAYSNNGSSEAKAIYVNAKTNPVHEILDYPYIQIFIFIYSGVTVSTALKFQPMICTKAAFGVSNKFVPYRPNYDLVCDTVNKANLSIKRGNTLTSGSLNDVINTMIANGIYICFSAGTSDVSDKPAQGIFMHRTTMIDSTTAMQEVVMLTGENKGRMYVRTYATSVWTAWKETTNA